MMDSAQPNANGRLVLLLIAGIPVTVILAASWLWYFVVQGELDIVDMLGTANHGELLQPPRQFAELDATTADGPFTVSGPEPLWSMLVPVRGDSCDAACEERLYLTRQIHVALGREFNRIRRVLVTSEPAAGMELGIPELSDGKPTPASLEAYLDQEQRGLVAVTTDPDALDATFAEIGETPRSWYLMDPAGWVMMRYDADTSYKDVIADLKFLLKNSSR
jgi:hypothetical protein